MIVAADGFTAETEAVIVASEPSVITDEDILKLTVGVGGGATVMYTSALSTVTTFPVENCPCAPKRPEKTKSIFLPEVFV